MWKISPLCHLTDNFADLAFYIRQFVKLPFLFYPYRGFPCISLFCVDYKRLTPEVLNINCSFFFSCIIINFTFPRIPMVLITCCLALLIICKHICHPNQSVCPLKAKTISLTLHPLGS